MYTFIYLIISFFNNKIFIYLIIYCRRILNTVQNMLKSGQKSKHAPAKPAVLPITSMGQMLAFENIEEATYLAVVSNIRNV